jgi:hypothetical protein
MGTGYKAILALDGEKEIELLNFHYNYFRQLNERNGNIESRVLGGIIELTFDNYPPTSIFKWGMKCGFKNGKLLIRHSDMAKGSYIPEETVTLTDAACVGLTFEYSRFSSTHYVTKLMISPSVSIVGDTYDWVDKNWFND